MKALQNSFTTPKQSKRLLELGVPADSADCFITIPHTTVDTYVVDVLRDELYSKIGKFTEFFEYIPCWSVGRLQEIFKICYIGESFQMWCNDDIFLPENLIDGMELRIKEMDFSKLEE